MGNDASAAALEVTLRGPRLLFHRAAVVAVCGGAFDVTVTAAAPSTPTPPKREVPMWTAFQVRGRIPVALLCFVSLFRRP